MAQKLKTISVSQLQEDFIVENDISPSRLVQNKVDEMMNWQRRGGSPEQIKELNRKLKVWTDIASEQRDFIEEKGLLDEFIKIQDGKTKQD